MSDPILPTDAIMWSTPERERAGRPLIVLLHGYGSHEGDLFSLSPALPLGPAIASLRAPLSAGSGFAWWDIRDLGAPDPGAVDAAARGVLAWLDSIDFTSVSLLGFSQGGALALQLLRLAPDRFASAVCLAGFVVPGDHAGDPELARLRPPVFWGRGTDDPVIPDEAVERTAAWLPEHADATIRIYEGLGHAVSTPELSDLVAFLREHS
jgi:phospholipase/carboxylesterase